MRGVRTALAVGLTVLAVTLGVVLSGAPLTVVGTNGVPDNPAVAYIAGGELACEHGGTLPQGTTAIRVSLSDIVGPRISLKASSGPTIVTTGTREAGWGIDESVTVPVRRVPYTVRGARICITIGRGTEDIRVNGAREGTSSSRVQALLRMEYLRPGRESWSSMLSAVAHDMGLTHAPGGTWVAYLTLAVMLAVCVLASRLILRMGQPGGRAKRQTEPSTLHPGAPHARTLWGVQRAAWTCALVASLSAACWSVITPPFQAPDEPAHFAYAQHLAETGNLPNPDAELPLEDEAVLSGLHNEQVRFHPEAKTIASRSEQLQLQADLTQPLSPSSPGGAGVASSEPPLYYALEAIPYSIGSSGTLLDQLELMRLLSALMAGLSAMCVFLFVRELLPSTPWAATVGGLSAALFPLLGFTSGVVTPDAMLCTVSCAIFYCLARAFRRGLTTKAAASLGLLIAVGFLTKVNFLGLAPGAILGLVVLGFRGVRGGAHSDDARHAFGPMALALAIGVSPVCAYVLDNVLNGHHTLGIVSSTVHSMTGNRSGLGRLAADAAYIWQFYLPRLPGMRRYFTGLSTTRQLWLAREVGLYGWLDTSFPQWVLRIALISVAAIAILALRSLITYRTAIRRHLPELVVYLAICLGLMVLLGQDAHLHGDSEPGWAQPRYLLPLLPMGALIVASAARGAGRRWGLAVGTLMVVLFLGHDIFSQLQVVARFYG
jgi:hypothetical protein